HCGPWGRASPAPRWRECRRRGASGRGRHRGTSLPLLAWLSSLGDLLAGLGLALNDAHDIAFLHDHELFAVDLDLGARPLAEEHAVAGLELERLELTLLVPRTDGDDFALLRLFLGGIWNDDATGCLLVRFDAAHDYAVMQGTEMHGDP